MKIHRNDQTSIRERSALHGGRTAQFRSGWCSLVTTRPSAGASRPKAGGRSPCACRGHRRRHVNGYFVLRYATVDGKPWKVDVSLWRLGEAPRELYFDPDTLCRLLTAETRGAILWIKDIWHRRPSYPDVVGGVDIYDAVLNHGVRAPAEFAAYLRARGMPAD